MQPDSPPARRLAYLTAGAAGMFCGSCLHDNTLARGLQQNGVDAVLIPTYTPIRTDEENVSIDRVFYGGVNVYVHQRWPWTRRLPGWLMRPLDRPGFLRWIAGRGMQMDPRFLGELTCSMLRGDHGNQARETEELIAWLEQLNPDLLLFTNLLIGGAAPALKRRLGKPIVVTLQGDDIFLDSLPEDLRATAIHLMRELDPHIDAFLTHSEYYAGHMQQLLGLPREKFRVTPLGLHADDLAPPPASARSSGEPLVLGYLARLAPEKGLEDLVTAYLELKRRPATAGLRLHLAGWLGEEHRPFAENQFQRLREAGWGADFEYFGEVDRAGKRGFLQGLDVLCTPSRYRDPKGLYVLEAAAAGVPVVQPAHGAFPELIERLQCGLLSRPGDPQDLCEKLAALLADQPLRLRLGRQGQENVLRHHNERAMAARTWVVLSEFLA